MTAGLVWVLAAGLAGCPRPTERRPGKADAGEAVADAGAAGEVLLSAKIVDQYVRYQKALAPLYAALSRTAEKADKGRGQAQAEARALVQLRETARLEENARVAAGLTEPQVARLDALVTELVLARRMANVSVGGEALRRLEALVEKLPEEQQGALARSLEERQKRQKALSDLSDLRRRYGDFAVELVLKREEELTRGHQQLTEQLLGANPEESVP